MIAYYVRHTICLSLAAAVGGSYCVVTCFKVQVQIAKKDSSHTYSMAVSNFKEILRSCQ